MEHKASEDSALVRIYDNRWTESQRSEMRSVWAVLTRDFFQQFLPPDAVILDLGAGFCGFINTVQAQRKIAIDANPGFAAFADDDVETIVSDDLDLSMIRDGEITHVFLSNFLEHLPSPGAVVDLLRVLRRKLSATGSILVLQPNYRFVGADYFDFIDHQVVLTDKSLVEALESAGFSITYMKKRFLPYTSKSNLPKSPRLVQIYLKLPFLHRVFGRQTFVVGGKQT